jgi:hypothetical protein
VPGESECWPYSVIAKSYITNPKICGIISKGCPYKTLGELGVHTIEPRFL